MITMFAGLATSLVYGVASFALVYFIDGPAGSKLFFLAYTISFKTLLALGLIVGTALLVFRSQNVIPTIIESAFKQEELDPTHYFFYKSRFISARRSLTFAAEFFAAGFIIFHYSEFRLTGIAEISMIVAGCVQYALGVYIGRKLIYAGMMLHSLLAARVTRNLFKSRALDGINTYVHVASTLTILFVYVHVLGYYEGPFQYGSAFGESMKVFLLLPALISTPVLLIFNFYPRAVLRKLYSESIDLEIAKLQDALTNEALSPYEKRSHLIAFDKMYRDELRYSLQLTLSDLPVGFTILMMLLPLMLKN
jgi:hypothetical protein